MLLKNDEYLIQSEGDKAIITITKEALLKWAEHYHNVSIDSDNVSKSAFYFGKEEVLLDILKHFDELYII